MIIFRDDSYILKYDGHREEKAQCLLSGNFDAEIGGMSLWCNFTYNSSERKWSYLEMTLTF